MRDPARPIIAVPVGDPHGIGPEIAIRAALDPQVRHACRPVLIADEIVLSTIAARMNLELHTVQTTPVNALKDQPKFGEVAAEAGAATIAYAKAAIQMVNGGQAAAVVAAPHNETAVAKAGIPFAGYPSLLAQETGVLPENVYLMLVTPRFRIVHQTLHVGLRAALDSLSSEKINAALLAIDQMLRGLGIDHTKIAVFGINPHAGEDGLFGDEDETITKPAVEQARAAGISVDGPAGADVLLQENRHDAYLAMFHDQGHIPAKLDGRDTVFGVSIGAPVLFSSVAHGSAHDIAGQGIADPSPMINALVGMSKLLSENRAVS